MSSSFKDNFGRDQSGGDSLQYDDSAFYYFFFSIIFVITVPWTYSVVKSVLFGKRPKVLNGKICNCTTC